MHETVAKYSQPHIASQSSSTSGTSGSTSLALRVPKRPVEQGKAKADASKDAVGSPQWERYNLFKDVVVRAEVMGEAGLRKSVAVVYAAVGLGFVALVALAVLKFTRKLESWDCGRKYSQLNLVVAFLDTVAMLVATCCYLYRIFDVTRRGFRWGTRRKRQSMMNVGVFVSHTISSILYLATNAIVLYDRSWINYTWFKYLAVMEYTMWNNVFLLFMLRSRLLNLWLDDNGDAIGRPDAMLLDAPWTKHCWLFGIWVAYQTVLLTGTAHKISNTQTFRTQGEFEHVLCTVPEPMLYFAAVVMGIMGMYHCLGVFFIYRGYKQLVRKPYNLFRGTHLSLRYHLLCAGTVGHLLALSFLLLFWIRPNSCGTGVLMWFGILPCHFLMTVLSVVMIVLVIPVKPGRLVTLDVAPKNPLVWCEAEMEDRSTTTTDKKSMGIGEVNEDGEGGGTTPQPPFCFETSVKMWYWSLAVYCYDPTTERCFDPKYHHMSLQVAMAMYELDSWEFIEEKVSDTKVMVGWNRHTIMVCFRGTYSATNVWTDLQFWRTVHSPPRGNYLLRTQPLVHKGFIKSWTASRLNHRILNTVIKIMNSGENFDQSRARVFVTGHSLGGALAVLASFDIARYCGVGGERITCYTYGAPRVGNHAFAREYDSLVPNTWQIINDEDLIPRMPKFWILFKHVGNKVIINQCGDMIVKPFMVEVSLYRMFTFFKRSSSVAQHLLLNYRKSFVAICKAQFMEGKALKGGMEAMLALLEQRDGLLCSGLGVETSELQKLHALGKTIWKKKCCRKKCSKKRCKIGRWKGEVGRHSDENSGTNNTSRSDETCGSSTSSEGQSLWDDESKIMWEV